ncbi:SDR family NAD(P)-dependent oxidoreductase [Flavivirga jejuensis]|uniref:SDR family NAD(P)-dependent oxidoreductase n=1 Tax=Flavivirga jejuensis TaxID=870487 RepID=A0ABT8WUW6_9FLAO|nr:SDR family NAD(P)-dependent oxidoreductase [Flavivirga jejuensis]MDO5976965.1 SDR family NAD(P)-dependent oxidoreductase [Flavivirga jejuensis]
MSNPKNKVAIVGIACRFPEAENYKQYWKNLIKGRDSIKEIPKTRWNSDNFYTTNRREPEKSVSKWCGLVKDATSFDHEFFGISAREAYYLDPQQRISLETAWHCMEDSGIKLETLQKAHTSVYTGVMSTDYKHVLNTANDNIDAFHAIGNYECILANRISHSLGLTGSSQSINAACASSLIAIHEAKKSLILNESDYVFAGGVSLNLHPWKYISFSKAGMLSNRGRCRTFDRSADGYVPGDGVGFVLLERMEDAIKNGHHIYGVISGSAVNHTGKSRGMTAPKIEAQKAVIENAMKDADVKASEIAYVEAHGTGTSLGDPIEVEALKQVYKAHDIQNESRFIGSVKTNIGHLEAAAGIAGVIKVLMMFKNKQVPPLLHINIPNPIIDFKSTPFKLPMKIESLPEVSSEQRFVAGISSFGFGGANSHIILASYNSEKKTVTKKPENKKSFQGLLFLLSSGSKGQIVTQKLLLKEHWEALKKETNDSELYAVLKRISRSLFKRRLMKFRTSTVVTSVSEYEAFLNDVDPNNAVEVHQNRFHIHIASSFKDVNTLHGLVDSYEELSRLGLVAKSMSGIGKANYLVGVLSGITMQSDVKKAIFNSKNSKYDALKFPKFPVWINTDEHEWLLPYLFTESYIETLLNSLELDSNDIRYYIDKARLLYNYQYTFQHYLKEWEVALNKKLDLDLNVEKVIKDEAFLFAIDDRGKKLRALLTLAIISSLKRLDSRWFLFSKQVIVNESFNELIDLIVDQVIQYEDLIDLVFNPDLSKKEIVSHLNNKVKKIDRKKSYTILKHEMKQALSLDDVWMNSWIDSENKKDLIQLQKSLKEKEQIPVIQFGGERSDFDSLDVIHVKDGKDLLALLSKLTEAGMVIKEDVFFSEEPYTPIALPGYPFKKVFHWAKPAEGFDIGNRLKTQKTKETQVVVQETRQKLEKVTENGILREKKTNEHTIKNKIENILTELLVNELKLEKEKIDFSLSISNYGIDSVLSNILLAELQKLVPDAPHSLFLEYDTFDDILSYLASNFTGNLNGKASESNVSNTKEIDFVEEQIQHVNDNKIALKKKLETNNVSRSIDLEHHSNTQNDFAIIGISGILPKSENISAFFENLEKGNVLTEDIPQKRLDLLGLEDSQLSKIKQYHAGFIDDIEYFDYEKFKFSYEEALQMDSQLRKLIETVWATIGNSGYRIKDFQRKETGVFVATRGHSGYVDIMKNANKNYEIEFPALYANRLSHLFNLKGPSEVVDTGCSAFIAAIDKASQAIKRGDCIQAIVATATLNLSYHELGKKDITGIYSKQNATKSFSETADGFVRSEAIGAIIIKPLKEAERDGDHIHGVIKGVGVYHGGKAPLKWNSPNIKGQKIAIKKAIEQSQIDPLTIEYIEAEANGNSFVDSSEMTSIQSVYRSYFEQSNVKDNTVFIGSLKPLTGHAETSSTFPCLLKLLSSVQNKKFYGVKGLTQINKAIQVKEHFSILRSDTHWSETNSNDSVVKPKRMAINCLGIGGVNTHLIFEEYLDKTSSHHLEDTESIFIFSDESELQLSQMLDNYLECLSVLKSSMTENVLLNRLAFTLQEGREEKEFRLAIKANTLDTLLSAIKAWGKEKKESSIRYNYAYNFGNTEKIDPGKIESCIAQKEWMLLAQYWVRGAKVNWSINTADQLIKRLPLPTTTLNKLFCWPFKISSNQEPASVSTLVEINKDKELVIFDLRWKESYAEKSQKNGEIEHHVLVCYLDISVDGITKNIQFTKVHKPDRYNETSFTVLAKKVLLTIQNLLKRKPKKVICLQIILPLSCIDKSYGISGLIHTCQMESTKVKPQLIFVDTCKDQHELVRIAEENLSLLNTDHIIKYENQIRYSESRNRIVVPSHSIDFEYIYKDGEVILITGGLGALGLTIAKDILSHTSDLTLILVGRSSLNDTQNELIEKLNKGASQVLYYQSDISKEQEVKSLTQKILLNHGTLDNIIHCAGVLRDSYILNKSIQELDTVFAPKINGATYLDKYTKNLRLRFFLCFSSLHALGNVGQADYSMANAYLDGFTRNRNRKVEVGKRHGRTMTINWPYWKDGGMQLTETNIKLMESTKGAKPLPTEVGAGILHYVLQSGQEQIIIDYGNQQKLMKYHTVNEVLV